MSKTADRDFRNDDLERLPDLHRSLLSAFAKERSSYEHLARTFDLPIGTVKSRISRARQKIARLHDHDAVKGSRH